jgi:hypothetical protein
MILKNPIVVNYGLKERVRRVEQENATNPWGCNSFPLIKNEGDPDSAMATAFLSSIL